jgi:hypothetical protein
MKEVAKTISLWAFACAFQEHATHICLFWRTTCFECGKCTGAHQCVIHFQEGFYPCKVYVRAFAVQYICDIVNVVDCGWFVAYFG